MTRALIILLTLSVGLNIGLLFRTSQGDRTPLPPDRPPVPPPVQFERLMDHHLEQMTNGLGLNGDQQAAIRTAHDRLFPSIRESHREVERLRNDAAAAFGGDVDANAFRARVSELSRAQATLDSLLTEVLLAEAAVLDPEQRQQYVKQSPWSRRIEEPARGAPPRRP
ncbi:MAG: periplasmic heavy metal sensor [Candidatus Eisenbacteria bacterium]